MPIVETPLDERSGTPLLIAPDEAGRVPRVIRGQETNCGGVVNTQHIYHPWPDATASPSLVMLHNAGGEEVLVDDHNAYNGYYGGPPLPTRPIVRLQKTFLHMAGFFPGTVIDFSRGEPRERGLTDNEKARWRQPGDETKKSEIRVIAPDVVRSHAASMVLADPRLAELKPTTRAKFLALKPEDCPADAKERIRLARLLLRQAIQPIVAPVVGIYREALNDGRLVEGAPLDPALMVTEYLMHSPKATRTMAQKLAMVLIGLRE